MDHFVLIEKITAYMYRSINNKNPPPLKGEPDAGVHTSRKLKNRQYHKKSTPFKPGIGGGYQKFST